MKRNVLFFILPLFFILSAVFILRSAYTIDNTLFFSLMDDEMISMRYAHNFANGHGLIWNPGGEMVEGFTNFLWVVYMSLFHLLPIPSSLTSLFIQISCVIFLGANIIVIKKLTDLLFQSSAITAISTILTAAFIPLLMWGIQGAETCILTLLTTLSVYLTCKRISEQKVSLLVFILMGIGILVRTDFLIIALPIILANLYYGKQKKKVFMGIGIVALFLLSHTLLRLFLFQEIFPNTYYLKMTGYPILLRLTTGIYVTANVILAMNWILFLIPFFVLVKKRKFIGLLAAVIFIQFLYNVYIGGDIGERLYVSSNRFISTVMPLFFVLFAAGLWELKQLVEKKLVIPFEKLRIGFGVLILFLIITSFNMVTNPDIRQLFFMHKSLGYVPGSEYNTKKALLIDKITKPDAKIAIFWAGTTPYFSNRTYIDLLGKNDNVIGHGPVNARVIPNSYHKFTSFDPGHTKWDYEYSFSLTPDISDPLPPEHIQPNSTFAKLLETTYEPVTLGNFTFYLRKNSPNIRWDQVAQAKKLKKTY